MGGYPVFRAREIYRAFVPTAQWDDNSVCVRGRDSEETASLSLRQVWTALPNPASTSVTIYRNIANDETPTVMVRNAIGSLVVSKTFAGGQAQLNIDLHGQPNGLYFYTVTAGSQRLHSGKIVLQH